MPLLIVVLLIIGGAFWLLRSRQTNTPGTVKKTCRWKTTGKASGVFTEYKCKTCGVIALQHTGKAPRQCKKDFGGKAL